MANDVFSEIKKFEERLSLPTGFYQRLNSEEDWSFVIKLNALIEAACTHALVARLHAPELVESFASIDLGNSKHGKITMLRKLNALTAEQVNILQLLYELRNIVAHDVSKVSFTFKLYLAEIKGDKRKRFIKVAGYGLADNIALENKQISREQFVLENPKLALWLTIAEIISCLYLENEIAKNQLQKLALEQFKSNLKGLL
jgi:hypothetical protein